MESTSDKSRRDGWLRRCLRWVTRFSLASFLWLTLLFAILVLWYLDHQEMQEQLGLANGVESPAWSIDQLRGAPDTAGYGDLSTAWASATSDGSEEWVVVEFPNTVKAVGIDVHETYNPGSAIAVYSVAMDGSEQPLWKGSDPVKGMNLNRGIAKISFVEPERTRRLRIVLDSVGVAGWNEIDAIGLLDDSGKIQWVSKAWASSSYGLNRELPSWFWP